MLEHLNQKQVEDYCRQQLRVAELLSVSEHLDGCEACRRRVEGGMNSDAAFFAVRSEVFGEMSESPSQALRAHLTPEQTAGHVDRNLSGEELQIVTDHLTNCEHCVFAVDDLRAFRAQIANSLEQEYHPAPALLRTENWWRRKFLSLSAPFRVSPAPAFGAALAILLLAVTGWFVIRTLSENVPEQEIVVSPTPQLEPASPPQTPPLLSQPEPVTVVAELRDGEGLLTLDQEGKLSGANNLPLGYQSLIKKALTSRRIERSSQLKGLSRPSSSLMSSDKQSNEFSVIEPVGVVVMSNQPTFRWTSMEGTTDYVVEVYDATFKLVTTSPQLTSSPWSASQPLPRGKIYTWQVKAVKDGQEVTVPRPPAPQATFRILDQVKANELAKAKRTYPSSHLVLGLLYAEAGLIREAEQEFWVLQKANPDSELARRLLRQVQALRR